MHDMMNASGPANIAKPTSVFEMRNASEPTNLSALTNGAAHVPHERARRSRRHRRAGSVAVLAVLLALVPAAGAHAVGATAAPAAAPTISQLAAFACASGGTEPCANGAQPGALIQGSDGNFYGAAATSFANFHNGTQEGGTIFKVTPGGQLTRLFTFAPGAQHTFPDGNVPGNDLVQGPDGFLYGTTGLGGAANGGVVFKLSTSGSGFQVLHSFCKLFGRCPNGLYLASLVLGSDGNLYGTTLDGGQSNCGVVYKITPSGTFTVVHALNCRSDGAAPIDLLAGHDGNLYGVSAASGASSKVFRVSLPGGQFSTIVTFQGTDKERSPLVQAADGTLFGTYFVEEGGLGCTSSRCSRTAVAFNRFRRFSR